MDGGWMLFLVFALIVLWVLRPAPKPSPSLTKLDRRIIKDIEKDLDELSDAGKEYLIRKLERKS